MLTLFSLPGLEIESNSGEGETQVDDDGDEDAEDVCLHQPESAVF